MLNVWDWDEILHAFRLLGELLQKNKLMIFLGYSVETQNLHKSFDSVKAVSTRNIRYSVLFPARLRVQDGETTRFFHSPREAFDWLDFLPQIR